MSCQKNNEIEVSVPLGNYELRFEQNDFGKDFEEKARKELRETPENAQQAIAQLRQLLADEPGLRYPSENENSLYIFLRPTKFYTESAFALMKKYYKFRAKHPHYFKDLLPSREIAPFRQNLLITLPLRTENGERVLVIEVGAKWKPKDCTILDIVRSIIILLMAALQEPRTQVAGAHVVIDLEGLSLNHIWQFTPTLAKDIVDFVQDCVPVRLKGVHIVFQPYIFNMLYAIFKPFLREKLRRRIYFHGSNFANLHEMVGKKVLPLKYDGCADLPVDTGSIVHSYLVAFEQEFKVKAEEGYPMKSK